MNREDLIQNVCETFTTMMKNLEQDIVNDDELSVDDKIGFTMALEDKLQNVALELFTQALEIRINAKEMFVKSRKKGNSNVYRIRPVKKPGGKTTKGSL